MDSQIAKQVSKCLEEHKERDNRATNIIVYKAKEPEAGNTAEKKAKDLSKAEELFEVIGVTPTIVRPMRIGKTGQEEPRPWKIQFADTKAPIDILRNARKLKGHEEFGEWSLAPDYTIAQREERRKLVTELRERKAQGEEDIGIRQNKIL